MTTLPSYMLYALISPEHASKLRGEARAAPMRPRTLRLAARAGWRVPPRQDAPPRTEKCR